MESDVGKVRIKEMIEPSNPLAGPGGRVYYIDVDPVTEMATLVSASRAYEANIRAYNINSKMTANALNIGGGNK
jgi:flagellar basal-body rod protein FlgC